MNHLQNILKMNQIRWIDHSLATTIFDIPNTALASFAIDDAIATSVGLANVPATIRFWVHPNTLVLGIPDARLPYLQEGLHFLQKNHHHAVIRNSGGLAVLLNEGVLNVSLIVANDDKVSIHNGYDMMLGLIQALFAPYTRDIQAYEIKGSYCPGDYDLSIDGKKFAGISQRRVRNGIAIQIYVDIEGSSKERAGLVRDFYRKSKKEDATSYPYPEVHPAVMASINELLGTSFTVQEVIQQIQSLLLEEDIKISTSKITTEEEITFRQRYKQMLKRNEKIKTFNPTS